ncbi:DNA-binding transcriptional activator CadC [Caballeronia calidae]|uniref:DNA-binding transcriptional activator CadC n=1 Tax=Caballeronia calidae TaxID=1777139 RepID=A0A158EEK8_9BURK|nr:winged helix-turn-helix domain-containing protein [Caballeronia calidae]SAL05203.1 DNA-binding transcriptional activator CadC [Caballeronia calidae]
MDKHYTLNEKFVLNDRWLFDPTQDRLVDLMGQIDSVMLKPVASRLLRILAHSPKTLLHREHLLDEGWRSFGFEVSENSLNQVMCALRTAFQALDPQETYIRTVPRIGYCFLASVRPMSDGEHVARAHNLAPASVQEPSRVSQRGEWLR